PLSWTIRRASPFQSSSTTNEKPQAQSYPSTPAPRVIQSAGRAPQRGHVTGASPNVKYSFSGSPRSARKAASSGFTSPPHAQGLGDDAEVLCLVHSVIQRVVRGAAERRRLDPVGLAQGLDRAEAAVGPERRQIEAELAEGVPQDHVVERRAVAPDAIGIQRQEVGEVVQRAANFGHRLLEHLPGLGLARL